MESRYAQQCYMESVEQMRMVIRSAPRQTRPQHAIPAHAKPPNSDGRARRHQRHTIDLFSESSSDDLLTEAKASSRTTPLHQYPSSSSPAPQTKRARPLPPNRPTDAASLTSWRIATDLLSPYYPLFELNNADLRNRNENEVCEDNQSADMYHGDEANGRVKAQGWSPSWGDPVNGYGWYASPAKASSSSPPFSDRRPVGYSPHTVVKEAQLVAAQRRNLARELANASDEDEDEDGAVNLTPAQKSDEMRGRLDNVSEEIGRLRTDLQSLMAVQREMLTERLASNVDRVMECEDMSMAMMKEQLDIERSLRLAAEEKAIKATDELEAVNRELVLSISSAITKNALLQEARVEIEALQESMGQVQTLRASEKEWERQRATMLESIETLNQRLKDMATEHEAAENERQARDREEEAVTQQELVALQSMLEVSRQELVEEKKRGQEWKAQAEALHSKLSAMTAEASKEATEANLRAEEAISRMNRAIERESLAMAAVDELEAEVEDLKGKISEDQEETEAQLSLLEEELQGLQEENESSKLRLGEVLEERDKRAAEVERARSELLQCQQVAAAAISAASIKAEQVGMLRVQLESLEVKSLGHERERERWATELAQAIHAVTESEGRRYDIIYQRLEEVEAQLLNAVQALNEADEKEAEGLKPWIERCEELELKLEACRGALDSEVERRKEAEERAGALVKSKVDDRGDEWRVGAHWGARRDPEEVAGEGEREGEGEAVASRDEEVLALRQQLNHARSCIYIITGHLERMGAPVCVKVTFNIVEETQIRLNISINVISPAPAPASSPANAPAPSPPAAPSLPLTAPAPSSIPEIGYDHPSLMPELPPPSPPPSASAPPTATSSPLKSGSVSSCFSCNVLQKSLSSEKLKVEKLGKLLSLLASRVTSALEVYGSTREVSLALEAQEREVLDVIVASLLTSLPSSSSSLLDPGHRTEEEDPGGAEGGGGGGEAGEAGPSSQPKGKPLTPLEIVLRSGRPMTSQLEALRSAKVVQHNVAIFDSQQARHTAAAAEQHQARDEGERFSTPPHGVRAGLPEGRTTDRSTGGKSEEEIFLTPCGSMAGSVPGSPVVKGKTSTKTRLFDEAE